MREQRRHPRFHENVVISFENATDRDAVGKGLDEMPCVLTELSEGGARIRTAKPVPVGTPLLLHLVLEGEEEDVDLAFGATARWTSPPDIEPPHEIGLEFAELEEDDVEALRSYIAEKLAEVG